MKGSSRIVKVKLRRDGAMCFVHLARQLRAVRGARARWDALSFTRRREYAEAITSAKKADTRARRVAATLAALDGKR